MKSQVKNFIVIFSLVMLFKSCNKNADKEKTTKKINEKSQTNFNQRKLQKKAPRTFKLEEKGKYSHNLQIIKEDSYFKSDSLDSIILNISVPNKNYKLINVYNVLSEISPSDKKGIIVHITDDTNNKSCKDSLKYILEVKVAVKDVISRKVKFNLIKGDTLNVIVLNDRVSDFTNNMKYVFKDLERRINNNSIVYGCSDYKKFQILKDNEPLIILPREQGGGVIVGNP